MRKSIAYALLAAGITAISGQIILIRELFTSFYGNELSIGFVLAIWLLGGSIGSGILGGLYADRVKDKLFLFSLAQFLSGFFLPLGVFLARVWRNIFGIGAGELAGLHFFLFSSLFTLLPITILLGFIFVLGCKTLPQNPRSSDIGRVYSIEAFGSAIGGILTSFFMLRFLGTFQIAFILASLNMVAPIFVLRSEKTYRAAAVRYLAAVLVVALGFFAASGGVDFVNKESSRIKWAGFKLLDSKDSVYGRIVVTGKSGQLDFFDNGLLLFSSSESMAAEEAVHFPLSFSARPEKILLIGAAASELINEILKYNVLSIDYVELDPLIVDLSKKYLPEYPLNTAARKKIKVINTDARYYVKNASEYYDAVIVNLPNPYTAQINRFYTKEFFGEVKRVLAPGGILSFGVTSSENYLSREQALFLKTLYETARSEFPEVKITAGDTAYFLISNKKGTIDLDYTNITGALKKRGITTVYTKDYYLSSRLSPERIKSLYYDLARVGRVKKNTDFYPISYFYDMVLWSTYFNFSIAGFLMFLTAGRLFAFSTVVLFLIFFAFLLTSRGKNFRKKAVLFTLATTGFSEISIEIMIVLAFQIIYGYLYYKIGVILTSFMLGLAIGSIYITKKLSRITRPFALYIKIQGLIFVYPVILLGFFKLFSVSSYFPKLNLIGADIFAILPFIAGFAGGLQYPLANKICFTEASRLGHIAGVTYAVDLLGSFAGAILISALFIPVTGIPLICLLLTILNFAGLALLIIATRTTS
ncbi:MAG: fused MFS/spermidine synthase [Candidatus Omnitrophica bacterium]|nr:fused MFS/spermidine synthase [Candidatus Omnitrophota bacterium]